jgi:cell wall-associated NlpC family hydrolase
MIEFNKKKIVEKYLGIPYQHMGRTLGGLDCWGFPKLLYADYGINLFDLHEYEKDWARHGKNLILENYYERWLKVQKPILGDLILFRYPLKIVSHVGVFLEKGRFIHATRVGIVQTRLREWELRIFGVYRYIPEG